MEPQTEPEGIAKLSARVRRDLALIAHPRMSWLVPRTMPDGTNVLDVLIIGAGQSGIVTAFGLKRARVDNILVLDAAARGKEGPWRTYARMHTLRSPKDFTGPDLDVPSLTYQSWHEAKFGDQSWQDLKLIAKEAWADYLLFVRDCTDVPVKNECRVTAIELGGPYLKVTARGAGGAAETYYARKIVLATGQDGMGEWWMPEHIRALPEHLRAHAADPIDFATLTGRTVAVLGAGASAFDNAATALEAGAAQVHLFCRRAAPQVIQPYRWLTFAGFLRHLSDLDDAWRWRFMATILALREGFPQDTYDRCARFDNFHLHSGAAIEAAHQTRMGTIELVTPKARFPADFVICGTGVEMDFKRRPELGSIAGNIATWADKYLPPAEERNERLGRFPYLAPDYAFVEKVPGQTPGLSDIHLFAIGSTMSFGPSGSSINAMTTAVPKLVNGITRSFFQADVERHWDALRAYDVPQAILGDAINRA
jgi:FAD-dependent urate hydroxylase